LVSAKEFLGAIWWLLSWLIYYGGWSLNCYDLWWGSGGAITICGKNRVSPSCWLNLSSSFLWMDVVVGERVLLAYNYGWLVARLSSSVFNSVQWLARLKTQITGFDQVTESILIFFKSKQYRFGKKKINRLQLNLTGSTLQVNRVFNYLYFFTNPVQF
jgi:hypothetical protein